MAKTILTYSIELLISILLIFHQLIIPILHIKSIIYYSNVLLSNFIFTAILLSTVAIFLIIIRYKSSHTHNETEKKRINTLLTKYKKWKILLASLLVILLGKFFLNILIPLFVVGSPIFMEKTTTSGEVLKKEEYVFKRRGMREPIREISLKLSDGKILKFNLNFYYKDWEKLEVGKQIEISHYPLIRDNKLSITNIQ